MKKTMIAMLCVVGSHVATAQVNTIPASPQNDTAIVKKINALEERLAKQEEEVQALKEENSRLQKQQKKATANRQPRFVISRQGSKQVRKVYE